MRAADRRRWFAFNGQGGDRTLADQVKGLAPLQDGGLHDSTVLDLGCAEGLLIGEFFRWGAGYVHGVEIVPEAVQDAREYLTRFRDAGVCEVFQGSIAALDDVRGLRQSYDVVTALAVMHKVPRPDEALRDAASRASRLLVLRNPPEHGAVIAHERQGGRRYDTRAIVADTHYLISVHRGHNDEWVGYFAANEFKGAIEPWTEH